MRSDRAVSTDGPTIVAPPALSHGSRQTKPDEPGSTGFLLTDLDFHAIYANGAALQILSYPQQRPATEDSITFMQQRIRSVLKVQRFTSDVSSESFVSGGRAYVCRSFLLESPEHSAMVAVLLDRRRSDSIEASEISRRFHLSPRESETIQHLSRGLTTKEIAHRMNISPNTVKQFVRFIMSKMGVTTRLGIISKIASDLFEVVS